MNKVIFIHGNGAMNWSFAWTPWLKKELEKLGITLVFETFPDSVLARKDYWLPFLKDYLHADEHTLIIGWSSGAVAAMRYAEENKIFGSILVSPCYTDLGLETEKISGYYDTPWNWEQIKENQKHICLVYSKNDEFIPLEEFEFIKEKLNPEKTYAFENKGHFINEKTLPEIVEYVKCLINQ